MWKGNRMYFVLGCRKCEHRLYVPLSITRGSAKSFLKKLSDIADNYDCPECGEEPYENWVLIGTAESFPGDEEDGEE